MLKRSLISLLLSTVVCATVSSQETGASADPESRFGRGSTGVAATQNGSSYHLSGVLITPAGRVALVNGKQSRAGDSIDGAEIVSIGDRDVRIRAGSQEFTVRLGGTVVPGRSFSLPTRFAREAAPAPAVPDRELAVRSEPAPALTSAGLQSPDRYHPVKRGETLSGIAKEYRSTDASLNQTMIALFQANPEAFSGNINVLYEGAVLRIPGGDELSQPIPAVATAEVARQQLEWQDGKQRQSTLANAADHDWYGPVSNGESLSAIAQRVQRDGFTLNQMMMALFQANPEAFSGNINVLYEGAVLRIPVGEELRREIPDTATAEVLRHTADWRAGYRQQARLITMRALNGMDLGVYR